jgi:hypothetical protein
MAGRAAAWGHSGRNDVIIPTSTLGVFSHEDPDNYLDMNAIDPLSAILETPWQLGAVFTGN